MARTPRRGEDGYHKSIKRGQVSVGRTKVGRGVFAARWFAQDQVIGEVEGEVIDDHDFTYSSRYCMDLGDHRCLEPGEPFRYMNHSCQPNCELRWFDIDEKPHPARRRLYVIAL
ncbi:MAG: SET domain-containing protein, partial [Singulisphaera sp.]